MTPFESALLAPQPHIGIIGLGYVGLPLALRFAEVGLKVTGFDVDPAKPAKLASGESYINYIPAESLRAAAAAGFTATTDFSRLGECDALVICVPTPLGKHREPDLSYVENTAEAIARCLRPGQLISLESTTYPGTTDEVVQPILERGGLKAGIDFGLVFSPERQDPGNARFGTHNIPKLVGGISAACLNAGVALYARVIDRVVPVSSTRVAEMAKLLENIHRAVNIGLVNEMKLVAEKMGIDIFEVIDAAATKPFGFTPYYPGPGLGGHCIPIDPFYLTWKAREYGLHTRFIELAGEINHGMPDYVIARTVEALNQQGKSLKGCKVLLLGIAYKSDVDDLRESPALELLEGLEARGAEVNYCDPFIPSIPPLRRGHYPHSALPLSAETLAAADVAILTTAHSAFDYALIARHSRLVIDTRGKMRQFGGTVVRA
ncbi:nucleotide sugar dehydrogenase [Stagnimonas aquatica]|uniref:Nucleotide sugar dehydrogenase n=1 Tax=Stagnimonas aquatica TaxID=2689987 RepID=A0A3N0VL02_9GAMM|nr:nucleotide sugar dehydrogenase [Stagnimonas aquatica]ROH93390.1 nucleotide sugar dehydrogenase [Stagnimonas aquatica]